MTQPSSSATEPRLFDENRLQGHLTGTEVMDFGRPALEVVLHRRTAKEKSSVVMSRIGVAVGLSREMAIDPRELVAAVFQHRLGEPAGRPMERPPNQDRL